MGDAYHLVSAARFSSSDHLPADLAHGRGLEWCRVRLCSVMSRTSAGLLGIAVIGSWRKLLLLRIRHWCQVVLL